MIDCSSNILLGMTTRGSGGCRMLVVDIDGNHQSLKMSYRFYNTASGPRGILDVYNLWCFYFLFVLTQIGISELYLYYFWYIKMFENILKRKSSILEVLLLNNFCNVQAFLQTNLAVCIQKLFTSSL